MKTARQISKELKDLSNKFKNDGLNNYHNKARESINKKYGKFWRENIMLIELKIK